MSPRKIVVAGTVTAIHGMSVQTRSASLADRMTGHSIPVESAVFVSPSCQPSHHGSAQSVKLSVILVVNMTGTLADRFVGTSLAQG